MVMRTHVHNNIAIGSVHVHVHVSAMCRCIQKQDLHFPLNIRVVVSHQEGHRASKQGSEAHSCWRLA